MKSTRCKLQKDPRQRRFSTPPSVTHDARGRTVSIHRCGIATQAKFHNCKWLMSLNTHFNSARMLKTLLPTSIVQGPLEGVLASCAARSDCKGVVDKACSGNMFFICM